MKSKVHHPQSTVGPIAASLAIVVAVVALGPRVAPACVGDECLQIWSTAPGGGALVVEWDPARRVQTYQSFCASGSCLYSAIDPGFIAPTFDDDPADAFHVLNNDTVVQLVLLAIDDGLSLSLNARKLAPGDTARLGSMPNIHSHPSWQIIGPPDMFGDFHLTFKLTTAAPEYGESAPLTLTVTNVPPVEPTPTPTVEPTPRVCPGDCTGEESVTISDLVLCVGMALGGVLPDACPACDADGDGVVAINEIIAAVNAALLGCFVQPPATLDEVQRTIFTPSCATAYCHDALSRTGELDLSAAAAYGELVGIAPLVDSARLRGMLRVDPGVPENSFLLLKLTGPPPGEGSRMPMTGEPLDAAAIERIRTWILRGAPP